jgi:taurine transport system substrate-binding protein
MYKVSWLSNIIMRRRHLRAIALGGLGAIITFGVGACGSTAAPSTSSAVARPSVVRATYFSEADYYTLAKYNNWLQEATGVPFEWTEVQTGAQVSTLYQSNELDMGLGVGNGPISEGIAEGIPFRVIDLFATSVGHQDLVVRKSLNYTGPQSLIGQTIATIFDSNGQLQLLYWLKLNHISTSQVTLVDMTANQTLAAFEAGSINVAYTTDPALTDIQQDGGELESTTAQLTKAGWFVGDMVTVSTQFAAEYPQTVEKILEVLDYAYDYWHSNPSATAQDMASDLGESVSQAQSDMATFDLIPPATVVKTYLGVPSSTGSLAGALLYDDNTEVSLGFIPQTTTLSVVDAAIDGSFLQYALSHPWKP